MGGTGDPDWGTSHKAERQIPGQGGVGGSERKRWDSDSGLGLNLNLALNKLLDLSGLASWWGDPCSHRGCHTWFIALVSLS